MKRSVANLIVLSLLMSSTPAHAADIVLLHAAGSLRGALTEVSAAYEKSAGVKVQAKYGPSGLLRDEIAGGAKAEVFASANMDHPMALAKAGKAGAVALFARNRLCALVKPGLAVTPDNLLERMLDPCGQARHLDAEGRSLRRLRVRIVPQGGCAEGGRERRAVEESAATDRRAEFATARRRIAASTARWSRTGRPTFSSPIAPMRSWRRRRIPASRWWRLPASLGGRRGLRHDRHQRCVAGVGTLRRVHLCRRKDRLFWRSTGLRGSGIVNVPSASS